MTEAQAVLEGDGVVDTDAVAERELETELVPVREADADELVEKLALGDAVPDDDPDGERVMRELRLGETDDEGDMLILVESDPVEDAEEERDEEVLREPLPVDELLLETVAETLGLRDVVLQRELVGEILGDALTEPEMMGLLLVDTVVVGETRVVRDVRAEMVVVGQ